jgi:hypothetical protein
MDSCLRRNEISKGARLCIVQYANYLTLPVISTAGGKFQGRDPRGKLRLVIAAGI